MPSISRKRRRNIVEDNEEETGDTPDPQPRTQRNNRRSTAHGDEDDEDEEQETSHTAADAGVDSNGEDSDAAADADAHSASSQLVKNLVRLALSSEYSRTALRRQDISAKVFNGRSREFGAVFDGAQAVLRRTFGMELVELPMREKVTLKERRAAATQAAASNAAGAGSTAAPATGTKAWVLQSVLPDKFASPDIIPPGRCPTAALEAAYVGLYSFVVAVIMLNGGVLADAKLERYLRRVNAETSTPVEKTDRLLQRMVQEKYLLRNKESVGGEEVVEYMVGPRGKVEIGESGVAGLVKRVYGHGNGDANEEQDAELLKKIEMSLKVGNARTQA